MFVDIAKSEYEFQDKFSEMEDAAVEFVRKCRSEIKTSASDNERYVLKKLYWSENSPRKVPLHVIENEFGLSHRQILEIIGPYDFAVPCAQCSDPVKLTVKNRDQFDYCWELNITCPDCYKERGFSRKSSVIVVQVKLKNQDRLAELRSMPYADYLASPEWQAKREEVFEARGKYCHVCRSVARLNVHHNTYEWRGDEAIGDLLVLCAECHQIFHDCGRLTRPV